MEDKFEKLGQAIDSLESCTVGLVEMKTLPDRIHVEGLRGQLPDILKELKESFIEITGNDPWGE